MGFNNGYDSGYSDCEVENRKRWEREAVERYKAENPPSGGSSGGESSQRAAKIFTLAAGSSTQLFDDDPDSGYDVIVTLSPFTDAAYLPGFSASEIDDTLSSEWSGYTWIPTAPDGGWVAGDTIVFGSAMATGDWGPFMVNLADSVTLDDTSRWDTASSMPFQLTYKGDGQWFGGWLFV